MNSEKIQKIQSEFINSKQIQSDFRKKSKISVRIHEIQSKFRQISISIQFHGIQSDI